MRFAAKRFWAFFFLVTSTLFLHAQTIQLKLLNGKTGQPIVGVCVGAWMTKDSRHEAYLPTDKNGVARLGFTDRDEQVDLIDDSKLGCGADSVAHPVFKYADLVSVYSTGFTPSCVFPESMPKARWKETNSVSVKEVLQQGVVLGNTCGKITVSPHPGVLVLFARPRNFHEKIQDWLGSDTFPF